jgi:hypothetical protein
MTRHDQHHAQGARLETVHQFRPDPERIRRIRDWHQAQVTSEQISVACLSMSITDCGHINTTGLAIEPEHALIFLAELESVSNQLRAFVEARRPLTAPAADILPFERRA